MSHRSDCQCLAMTGLPCNCVAISSAEWEAEIRERLAKISPAPWCLDDRYPRRVYCDDSLGSQVADCHSDLTIAVRVEAEDANAAFIANSPSDLSFLLDLVASLRKDAERLNWLDASGREHGRLERTGEWLLSGALDIREAIDRAMQADRASSQRAVDETLSSPSPEKDSRG